MTQPTSPTTRGAQIVARRRRRLAPTPTCPVRYCRSTPTTPERRGGPSPDAVGGSYTATNPPTADTPTTSESQHTTAPSARVAG